MEQSLHDHARMRKRKQMATASGVARTQPMPGHSVGTLCLRRTQAPPSFKPLAVRNAEATRGVWGILPQKIFGIFELHRWILRVL